MEELYRLISDNCASVIRSRLSTDKLCEVRIYNGAPIRVCYDGTYYFLCKTGLTKDASSAFTAGPREAEETVMRACEHSLYTVTDTIKRGYIAVKGGIRVGVCGVGVMTGAALVAVKDFTSVNIRLPHEVKGCADAAVAKLLSRGMGNTLVISPPGAGKTTFIRDLCRNLSQRNHNVLLCDEKHEIASVSNGIPMLDVGPCTDVISGTDKQKAFEIGIANMRPDVIIADELFSADIPGVRRAATCGIAVIATVHAKNRSELRSKPDFKEVTEQGLFKNYIEISDAPYRSVSFYESAEL